MVNLLLIFNGNFTLITVAGFTSTQEYVFQINSDEKNVFSVLRTPTDFHMPAPHPKIAQAEHQ